MSVQRPYVSFAEVKEKVTIPDVLQAFGITDRFTQKGSTLTGVCPFPSHQHGPSPNPEQFKINCREGIWLFHCFGDCNRGGDVVEFTKAMTGFDNGHVRFWFAEKFGDRLTAKKTNGTKAKAEAEQKGDTEKVAANPPAPVKEAEKATEKTAQQQPNADPPAELKPLGFHLRLDSEVAYLKERGLMPETIERYGLGQCNRGVLKGYIAIPIHLHTQSAGENPVAYLGRWPGEDYDEAAGKLRYRWPDGFPKSRVVYGLREALITDKAVPLIVVEGSFKVFHLVQAGFPSTVAVMGSSLSDEQAAILVATGRPIILFFDGNEAGQTGMRLAAAKLIRLAFVRVVSLPDGKEPDELPAEELGNVLSFINP
jgi:DNA primase